MIQEQYINNADRINLYIYSNGSKVAADATPTVTAVDYDTGDTVAVDAVQEVTASGETYYWTKLDGEEVGTNRTVVLTWEYDLDGSTYHSKDYVSLVRPFVTYDQIYQRYPQFAPDGESPKSHSELKQMESKVRHIIQSHTGQEFSDLGPKTFRVFGPGSNYLGLDEPIYELEYVAAEDPKIVLYDQTLNPSGELYERDDSGVVIPGTSYAPEPIEIVSWDKEQPWVLRRKFTVGEDWNNLYPREHISPEFLFTRNIFESKRSYLIRAKAGWQKVPVEVTEAALILIGDYYCPDVAFHEKGLESVTSADYNFKYDTEHYKSTGNVMADQLLDKYIENRWVVI